MPSQYRTIGSVKYERDLLEEADASTQGGTVMNKERASKLWDMAMDGNKVTAIERKTIEYIMSTYALDDAAKRLLQENLIMPPPSALQRKSTGYYKTMGGIKYDRKLLEEGQAKAAANRGRLVLWDVLSLWAKAHDGKGVTDCERRTIELLVKDYQLDDDARDWVKHELGVEVPPNSLLDTPPANTSERIASFSQHVRSGLPPQPIADKRTSPAVPPQGRAFGVSHQVNSAPLPQPGGASANSQALALVPPEDKGGIGGMINSMKGFFNGLLGFRQDGEPAKKRARLEAPTNTAATRLNPDLQELLRSGSDCPPLALGAPQPEAAPAENAELIEKRAEAAAEITRILGSPAAMVLGGGSKDEQYREFRRIALLLHPDKGIVKHDDGDANLAMRLALAALKKSRA